MSVLCSHRPWRAAVLLASGLLLALSAAGAASEEARPDELAAGERLVHNLDCNVCHTPKVLTPEGPRPDPSRLLAGHPADEKLPALPEGLLGPSGWGGLFNHNLTAWAGPWGVSFGSNLTPDADTGIGSWTEKNFADSLRTGIRPGDLRPFLPPMPTYARLTDEEIHAIFVYLRSIPPVANAVPAPMPPPSPPPKLD